MRENNQKKKKLIVWIFLPDNKIEKKYHTLGTIQKSNCKIV